MTWTSGELSDDELRTYAIQPCVCQTEIREGIRHEYTCPAHRAQRELDRRKQLDRKEHSMKRLIVLLAVIVTALAFASTALGWNADGVSVTTSCNTATATYTVTASIDQSSAWPGAVVKSITPATFAGTTSGNRSVVVVIGWSNSTHTQTFNKTVTLSGNCTTPVPDPVCPDGYTSLGRQGNVLLCGKTDTVIETKTETVYVDRPVETVKTVYVDRPVEVVKEIVKTITTEKLIPGKTVYKTKTIRLKGKTVKVYVYRVKLQVKKVPVIGVCKRPGGGTSVQGSG